MQIRPISDLRNKFTEIEQAVQDGSPVYLTKHGYGSMVVLSMEAYTKLISRPEPALDQADYMAENDKTRLNHEEVFDPVKNKLKGV